MTVYRAALVSLCLACAQTPSLAAPPEPAVQDHAATDPVPEPSTHLFGVLPNYNTTNLKPGEHPITWRQKFTLAAKGTFDPMMFLLVAATAAPQRNYGDGLDGFVKQYAASYVDTAIGNFMTTGIMPSLLRQDPRYYRRGRGSVWKRALYSASRTVVTYGDSGHPRFNAGEFAGTLAAAGLSNTYYPAAQRSWGATASRWGVQMTWDTVSTALKEFGPDLTRLLPGHDGQQSAKRETPPGPRRDGPDPGAVPSSTSPAAPPE